MITNDTINALEVELKRVQKAIAAVKKNHKDSLNDPRNSMLGLGACREGATLRRASMDLTIALANLRRGNHV